MKMSITYDKGDSYQLKIGTIFELLDVLSDTKQEFFAKIYNAFNEKMITINIPYVMIIDKEWFNAISFDRKRYIINYALKHINEVLLQDGNSLHRIL